MDHRRSLPLRLLRSTLTGLDVSIFQLQKECPARDDQDLRQWPRLLRLLPPDADFLELGAFARALDLVISVDTSVAHLCGALGVPVWVPLAFSPDWRWGTTGMQTPWYPSMRLFRQQAPGDWLSALQTLKGRLKAESGRPKAENRA
jgi:hypothetical protein